MTAFVQSCSVCHAIAFPALTFFISLTEPGGYLQWDEGNPDQTAARAPRPEVSNKACAELLALLIRFGKISKLHTELVILMMPRNHAGMNCSADCEIFPAGSTICRRH
jgi:hypothetical protein